MNFKEATTRMMSEGITAQDIAEVLGLAPQTIRAMRLDPESPHHRNAPPGWRKALASLLATKHASLEELRRELTNGQDPEHDDR